MVDSLWCLHSHSDVAQATGCPVGGAGHDARFCISCVDTMVGDLTANHSALDGWFWPEAASGLVIHSAAGTDPKQPFIV